ncbi:alpha-L-fucosidase [Persicobacter psychrovividus]|uniref:alpha-L-fucosidase n=1 Tax=Persicobacter psychrovividus TaxID=387638 RepID=A0ABM7VMR0_9BACT|nr:alpha-L-fucosidase [Persicobacter psychrovividus]
MRNVRMFFTLLLFLLGTVVYGQKKYEDNWESLLKYETPEWFQDAKFGIFIHWGPTTVPGFMSEWYGYHMYRQDAAHAKGDPNAKPSPVYEYHLKNYGPIEEYGYTKFIPEFKAEQFDANEWVDLFVKAGAKYVVPVGEHCDGFAMYDSKVTRWNSVKMGPKQDIVGSIFKVARENGLKVGTSSHFAFGWHWWVYRPELETMDPKLKDFYGKPHDPWSEPSDEFVKLWYKRSMDLMEQYKPDLFWFDLGYSEPAYHDYGRKFMTNFYNMGLKNGKEVVMNYKNIKYKPVPDGAAVLDIESGKLDRINEQPWQTDMSLGGWRWGWTENYELRKTSEYINDFIDIVSKNGCLLLNVAPDKHGKIPQDQVNILLEMGEWLKVNGEGIYESRPFKVFGQGPTNAKMVLHGNIKDKGFTSQDFRFTQNGQNVYAYWLKPQAEQGTITLRGFGTESHLVNDAIAEVTIMGHNDLDFKWIQSKDDLIITVPEEITKEQNAIGFKIALEEAPNFIL